MVWVVEYNDIDAGITNVSVWDDEFDARQDICAAIINDINDNWDLTDPVEEQRARTLEAIIVKGQHIKAIETWNDMSSDNDWGIFWCVEEKQIFSHANAAVIGSVAYSVPVVPLTTVPLTGFTNTPTIITQSIGATCRACKNWNEYATPDSPDGTYACSQCSTFSSIFGVKP